MTNKKQKSLQSEPFEDNYERMTSPIKKLLAGIKKEDLYEPLEDEFTPPEPVSAPLSEFNTQIESTQVKFTQVENAQVSSTQVDNTQVDPAQVENTQVGSTQSTSTQVKNVPVKFTQVDNTQADPTRVENTQIKSTQVVNHKVEIESNFTKIDNDILDKAIMNLTASEFIAYLKLYRLSYGFKVNTCRIGRGKLSKICNLKSDKTVQIALAGLEQKGYIKPVDGKESNPRGTLYRIYLPQEVDNPQSLTRVKFTQADSTQVDSTQIEPTQVKTTQVEKSRPLKNRK